MFRHEIIEVEMPRDPALLNRLTEAFMSSELSCEAVLSAIAWLTADTELGKTCRYGVRLREYPLVAGCRLDIPKRIVPDETARAFVESELLSRFDVDRTREILIGALMLVYAPIYQIGRREIVSLDVHAPWGGIVSLYGRCRSSHVPTYPSDWMRAGWNLLRQKSVRAILIAEVETGINDRQEVMVSTFQSSEPVEPTNEPMASEAELQEAVSQLSYLHQSLNIVYLDIDALVTRLHTYRFTGTRDDVRRLIAFLRFYMELQSNERALAVETILSLASLESGATPDSMVTIPSNRYRWRLLKTPDREVLESFVEEVLGYHPQQDSWDDCQRFVQNCAHIVCDMEAMGRFESEQVECVSDQYPVDNDE